VAALVITAVAVEGNGQVAYASSLDETIKELQQKINQIEQNQSKIEQERKNLEEEIDQLEEEKKIEEQALKKIEQQISQTEANIRKKEQEVADTTAKVKKTEKELTEAEQRVEKRKEDLIVRLRAIYESGGSVSYLDVLMGANSMGDFLQRLDFLGYIMEKDQSILTAYIKEKERVEAKKQELDQLLAKLNNQLTDLEGLRSQLRAQKKDREVKIASIREEQRQLAIYDEEKQQELLALANQKSALIRQKHAAELKKMEEERARRGGPTSSRGASVGGGGELAWPVPGYGINSSYGMRWGRMHYGVDMAAPRGTSVVAAEDGYVSTVVSGCSEGNTSCGGGFGNHIVITHPGGIDTLYAHLSSSLVSEGQRVSRGQVIGKVGNTGHSFGPHLHFEVHKGGQRVNPTPYLR
jgi:murein DD-endopeptidase MepM/ murein hydrolase activator NlpD